MVEGVEAGPDDACGAETVTTEAGMHTRRRLRRKRDEDLRTTVRSRKVIARTPLLRLKHVLKQYGGRKHRDYIEVMAGIVHLASVARDEDAPLDYSPEFYRGLLAGVSYLANDLAVLSRGGNPVFLHDLLWKHLEERLDKDDNGIHFVRRERQVDDKDR